jgi:hypothetical protein
MHLDGPNTLVDILADGILLVQRLCVEDALSACLKCIISCENLYKNKSKIIMNSQARSPLTKYQQKLWH